MNLGNRFWPIILVFSFVYKTGLAVDTFFDEVLASDEYAYMNLSADPCEDFYEYTCGNFKAAHPLREGQVIIDQFSLLEERLTSTVLEILKTDIQYGDPVAVRKAKMAYQACTDHHFINSHDLIAPEVEAVKRYGGFPILETALTGHSPTEFGWNEIADIASDFGINIFFAPSLYYDTQNASRNILRIVNESMDIPVQFRTYTPDSYEEAIEEGFFELANAPEPPRAGNLRASTRAKIPQMEILLRKLVLKLKRHLGSRESDEYLFDRVANISNFMKGIYYGGYMPEGTVVLPLTEGTTVTLRELNEWTKKSFGVKIQLDWVEYVRRLLKHTNLQVDEDFLVVNPYPSFNVTLYQILNWVAMNDPAIVKCTALLRAFIYMAADSDTETREDFNTYLRAIGKRVYSRKEYCARRIMDATGTLSLGLAVAHEYKSKYFDESKLQSASLLISDLQASFKEIIDETHWMEDESKIAAQKKADNIVTLLGYPEFISSPQLLDQFYENLPICSWNNYENAKALRSFEQAYTLNMINYRNRKAWEKSPFNTNAYYNRQNNRIIFPVAMLNPIFFRGTGSILDYSRIGMIIAHEINHGFDFQGRLYNPEGVLGPWWTNITLENFSNQTQCFVDQYSKYFIPEINSTISGEGSLNENLADNGGLRTAYKAVKRLLSEMMKKKSTQNFTNEQLFFIGYGTMWCNNEALSYLKDWKKTCDETNSCHFQSKWRVNGVVSNMEEFSEAFSCPLGSPMNPEIKCRLW